jgi:hypothetical protein
MGPTASGTGGGDGLKMAGVAVRPGLPLVGGPKLPVPSTLPSARPVVYEETRIAASRTSLSAPLRPAARIIPRLIEARFTGRVVYTMIISKPKMPMYMEDWILWFAEKDPMPGNAPLVRSPLPVRKVEPVSDELKVPPTGRVQLAATILKDGHVDSPRVFDGAKSEASQAAIRDLQSWQFLPALRAGDPVEVEIVIEVVFQNGGTEGKH